jgi:hypothetical protein
VATTVRETFVPRGSAHLAAATDDPGEQTLEIEFTSGDVYTYSNVPSETYSGLTRAGSAGQYFHRQIQNVFDYERQ